MRHLPPTKLQRLEFAAVTHYVKVPHDLPLEAIVNPPFWAHHANTIRRGDFIRVVADDYSWVVQLMATDVATGFVKTRPVWANIDQATIEADGGTARDELEARERFKDAPGKDKWPCIDFKTATGWRVIGHEGKDFKTGLASEADAKAALSEYIKRSAPPKGAKAA